ncbi:glucose-1-phosphate cytidylyltransferase [Marinoscillum furvescens]|uniref:Glucose-1-phosphate cytidylyltransferase n=1 Tax=Marinoscillum furvescens DSM 4134 TaxID=1122208 RepID=A0A3D9L3F8_MARFU|nr:glucose-1-phosphate cytidylyltransferase [Marinoscillum furvescens]RED96621.1 glucose-1-phosphate cytidylyltransferase [Marinoscillum furvescens DSM 4134]
MKVVLLAGGFGTRLSEETDIRPKPMVEIGGKPILWHIMKMYEKHGFNDFIICLGYKGYYIKEYFFNYFMHNSDLRIDLETNNVEVLGSKTESFKISLIDTGLNTKTAGRLKRIQHLLAEKEDFLMTYGDGVSDVNLTELVEYHKSHKKAATLTAIQPEGKFGGMDIEGSSVKNFIEKPKGDGKWINGGFFVLSPRVFEFIPENADDVMWEEDPLVHLSKSSELMAYKHSGFWKCMDALRDKMELQRMWEANKSPWKTWK